MVKTIKKIILVSSILILGGILFVFSITRDDNVALKKQVIGTIKDLKIVTDGVSKKENYSEFKDFSKFDQYLIIVLNQAKYINSIKLHWIKKFEPALYRIEVSKSLFDWIKIGEYKITSPIEKGGILITSHKFKSKTAFFVRVTILKPKASSVRISEIELFTEKTAKLVIKNQKVDNIKEHSANISFLTTTPSTGYIRFGESENNLHLNIGMEMDVFTSHLINAGNLLKGTAYYYQPVVRDLNGNLIIGKVSSFKTKGIPLPKYLQVKLDKINIFDSQLKWLLNVPCKTELFLGTSDKNRKSCYKKNTLQIGHTLKINKLIPETTFYYKIESIDKFNNKIIKTNHFTTKPHNIALKKRAYGSFYFPPEGQKLKPNFSIFKTITDGNYDLNGHAGSDNLAQKDQIAIVDLKEKFNIRKVGIIFRATAYPELLDISISHDMKKWDIIKQKINMGKKGKRILSRGSKGLLLKKVFVDVKNKAARYIQVAIKKNTKVLSDLPFDTLPYLQLSEIEVYKKFDYGDPQYVIEKIK